VWGTPASGLSTGRKHRYCKENTETLNDASREVSLEINIEKTKYMLVSHYQNAHQNQDIKIANRSFKNV
jgi:hypothetical protein